MRSVPSVAVLALSAAALAAGCASGRARRDEARALAGADAAVRDGCYACLRHARHV